MYIVSVLWYLIGVSYWFVCWGISSCSPWLIALITQWELQLSHTLCQYCGTLLFFGFIVSGYYFSSIGLNFNSALLSSSLVGESSAHYFSLQLTLQSNHHKFMDESDSSCSSTHSYSSLQLELLQAELTMTAEHSSPPSDSHQEEETTIANPTIITWEDHVQSQA